MKQFKRISQNLKDVRCQVERTDRATVSIGMSKNEQTLSNKLSQDTHEKEDSVQFFSKQSYQLSRSVC